MTSYVTLTATFSVRGSLAGCPARCHALFTSGSPGVKMDARQRRRYPRAFQLRIAMETSGSGPRESRVAAGGVERVMDGSCDQASAADACEEARPSPEK